MNDLILLMFTLLAVGEARGPCRANNCYRRFNGDRHTISAKSYCSEFTTSVLESIDNLPWASKACTEVEQISSICSCAYPAPIITTDTLEYTAGNPEHGIEPFARSTPASAEAFPTSSNPAALVDFLPFITPFPTPRTSPEAVAESRSTPLDAFSTSLSPLLEVISSSQQIFQSISQIVPESSSMSAKLSRPSSPVLTTSIRHNATVPRTRVHRTRVARTRIASSTTVLKSPTTTTDIWPSNLAMSEIAALASSPDWPVHTPRIPCTVDSCLQEFKEQTGPFVSAFCFIFTSGPAAIATAVAVPLDVRSCWKHPISQLSSACSCIDSDAFQTAA